MAGVAGFVRAFAVVVVVLLLPLGMAVPASAAQTADAKRTAGMAAAVSAQSRASALAVRRAFVQREMRAGYKGAQSRVRTAERTRRPEPADIRRLIAAGRVMPEHRFAGPRQDAVRAGTFGAATGSTAADTTSAEVNDLALVGASGPVSWIYAGGGDPLASGMPAVPSISGASGAVIAGQTVTAYAEVYNDYDGCNSTFTSCPNVNYQVEMSWVVQCWNQSETFSDTETVTAPSAWAVITDPSLTGALASYTFTVPSALCAKGYAGVYHFYPDNTPNFFVTVQATVVSTGDNGYGGVDNYEFPSIAAAQLAACNCSADSAAPGSEVADAGDPVDTVSGAYAETMTDASVNSPGYPLTVSRSYSSADSTSGPLGTGWSVPWDAALSTGSSTGDVTFTAENGDQYVYVPGASGGFIAPPGARSVLAEVTDSSGSVTGYTLTDPADHVVLTFNATGVLESQTDATGRGLIFGYNSSGQVSSITDAAGHAVTLSYDGSLLTGVALPDSQVVSYGYNSSGQLTSVTDPGNAQWQYTYTPAGLLATVEDPDQHVTVTNTYNSSGQVTQQEDGVTSNTYFSYTTTTGGLSETDVTAPDGGITTYLYCGGMLLQQIGPVNNAATGYVYDLYGEPVIVTDPLGRVTQYGYDGSGNLTSQTDPLGNKQQWTYDSHDNVLSYQDGNGNTTNFAYNSMDEMTSVTAPSPGGETTYAYDASGNLVSSTDARGNVAGANAAAYTSTYGYDPSGQLTSVTDPDGNITRYTYDTMGFPLTVTDPRGHVTSYAYDSGERVARVTPPAPAGVTKYGYDLAGNLVSRTDPDTNTWTYSYDGDNRLNGATDPLGNAVSYRYDGDGNQVLFTDARQITTATVYDLANRPTKVTYSDGTPAVSYTYDADSNVTSVTDRTGTRTLAYNADGEMTSGGGFSYSFDNNGDVKSRTYPDGTAISYGYNLDGQVSSMTVGSAQTTYSYDPAGNLVSTAEPNGITESRSYDNAGQLTGISDATSSAVLDSYGLALDPDGQPTQVAVTQDGTAEPTRYYGYDNAGRLTSACYSSTGSAACSAAAAGTGTGTAPDPGPVTGAVTGGEIGMCLDDAADSGSAGNKIQVWHCLGNAEQTLTVTAAGQLKLAGGCVTASGTSAGSLVALQPCVASSGAQQWRAGSGSVLVSAVSGLCLDDPGGSTTNGTQADIATCSGSAQQEWGLPGGGSDWITAGITGICADDSGGSASPGAAVVIWACNGNTGQQKWSVTTAGQMQIHSLCAQATTAATSLALQTCSGATSQEWDAGPTGWVWNVGAQMCMSDFGAATTNGSKIVITGCSATAQQSWRLPPNRINSGVLANGIAGECADNSGGTKAVIWSCNNTGAQQWAIGNDANIRTLAASPLCWTLSGGSTASSTPITLTPCAGNIDQEFAQGPAANPWVTSVDGAAAGLCVSDPQGSTTNGTQLLITACNTNPQQDWPLPPTTAPWTPAAVTATAGAASVTVSWTPASTGGDTLTGYTITASPGGQTATAGPYNDSATVAGLPPGTAYTLTITAASPAGTAPATAATTAVTPGNETTYSYDPAGNMTGSQTDGLATASTFNADEQLTSSTTGSATTTYGYDLDGNQTSAGSTIYAYNAASELTGAGTPAGNFTYAYDSGGNLTSTSLYGNPIQGTVWDRNNPQATAAEDTSPAGAATADYAYTPDGSLAAMLAPAGTYYPVRDWLGSLTGLTNSAGTQVTRTQYSAYGTPGTSNLITGAPSPSIGYAGAYTLPGGAGLDDMRAREYDPVEGQFTSIDPIVAFTGLGYAYTADNPASYSDPTGLCAPAWACNGNLGKAATVIGGIGLFVGLVTCPECDVIAAGADIFATVLSGIQTGEDLASCNPHDKDTAMLDGLATLLSAGGAVLDVIAALRVVGKGLHVATAAREAEENVESWPIYGRIFDAGGLAAGGLAWYFLRVIG